MAVEIEALNNPGQGIGMFRESLQKIKNSRVTNNRPKTTWTYPDLGPKMRPPQIGTKYTPKSAILHGEWGVEIGGLKNSGQDVGFFSKTSSKNYEIRSNIK